MNDVLYLYQTTYTKDKYGQDVPTNTKAEVFCDVHSISRQEFFNAGRNGLNPQYVFSIFKGEYAGERVVEYNGQTYSVYRTYETDSDYIELYVERKGGTNGQRAESND